MTTESSLTSPEQALSDAAQSTTAEKPKNLRSLHPSAMREGLPEAGFPEYWYPGVLDRAVGHKKPKTAKRPTWCSSAATGFWRH